MTTPPIFPTLNPGWSVVKRPKAGNTLDHIAGTGKIYRTKLWAYPMWEWDLLWDYLPDTQANGVTASDFRTLLGAFTQQAGRFRGFLYQDQDEFQVTGQQIGVGDGVTTSFLLLKSYGQLAFGYGIEPIGWLNTGQTFNLYVNGVAQTLGTQYSQVLASPCLQSVSFVAAPAAGQVITADLSFYYYVHFKDDQYDFDNFAYQLWRQKKITLESLRG